MVKYDTLSDRTLGSRPNEIALLRGAKRSPEFPLPRGRLISPNAVPPGTPQHIPQIHIFRLAALAFDSASRFALDPAMARGGQFARFEPRAGSPRPTS